MMMSLWRSPQFWVMSVIARSRDAYLPLRRPRLALLVDGQRDHRRAVLCDQAHDPG